MSYKLLHHTAMIVNLRAIAFSLVALLTSVAMAADLELQNSLGQSLRLIQTQRFEMGADDRAHFTQDHPDFNSAEDDRPTHPVILTKPFYVAATEVTVSQFQKFVEASGYQTTAERNGHGIVGWDPAPDPDREWAKISFRQRAEFNWKHPGFPQQGNHPVVGVSYQDAKAFCAWLSKKESAAYRLPTEAEWECVCRAGTSTPFSFGSQYRQQIHQHANGANVELERAFPGRALRQWLVDVKLDVSDRHVFTAPVGSYQENPWKLHDLHGNVWEWCEDRYLDTFYKQFNRPSYRMPRHRAVDPLNTEPANDHGDWRVIRGGSWFNAPLQCSAGLRGYFEADDAACYLGFRVVREAPPRTVAAAREQYETSQAALEKLKGIARQVYEDHPGVLLLQCDHEALRAETFAALEQLQEPVEVQLDALDKLTADHIAAFCRTPRLRGLMLSRTGPNLHNEDFAPLAEQTQMGRLQITGTGGLTDDVCQYFTRMTKLTSLSLHGDGITDEGLLRLPKLDGVTALNLDGTQSKGLMLRRILGSPLRTASFSHLNDEGATLLGDFPTLRDLTLQDGTLTGRGLGVIASIDQLEQLNIRNCQQLADRDLAAVGKLLSLQRLDLTRSRAGDATAKAIDGLNRLHGVHLGSEALTDDGVRALCELVSLRDLTLSAEATNITDAGFADFWRLRNLDGATIAAPRVTGSTFQALAELPKLRRINLNSTATVDQALHHLAKSESLEKLFVGDWRNGGPTALTDAGLLKLADAPALTELTLMRRGTQVTDEGIARLRELKPDLQFRVHD